MEDHALSIRLSDELYDRLRQFAFEQRMKQIDVIRRALSHYLQDSGGQYSHDAHHQFAADAVVGKGSGE